MLEPIGHFTSKHDGGFSLGETFAPSTSLVGMDQVDQPGLDLLDKASIDGIR